MKRIGGIAAATLMLASVHALGADKPYLEGTFYLDPIPGGITGGVWRFDKDDGVTRQGALMQTLKDGKLQSFTYFDYPIDGQLYWLNDWYKESNTRVDNNTFSVSWEAYKGPNQPIKGGPVICKINEARDKFVCDGPNLHEVYSKSGPRPKVR